MNGATALDCEKTIRRPKSTNTMTIGTSQYFFSWRRNCQNSATTRPLLMKTSKHPRVVLRIAVPLGMRRPSGPAIAAPRERIFAREPPDRVQRHQDDEEQQRQQHARVHV